MRSDNYSQSVDIRTLVNVKKLHFKSIYYSLRSISATPPTAMTWISKYLPQDEIRNVYTIAARVKSKNKVREMQYKTLNKYLGTNVLFKKMNRKDSKICRFLRRGNGRFATPLFRLSCDRIILGGI